MLRHGNYQDVTHKSQSNDANHSSASSKLKNQDMPSSYMSGSFDGKNILIQPVLSYIVFSMMNSSGEYIKKAVDGRFNIRSD